MKPAVLYKLKRSTAPQYWLAIAGCLLLLAVCIAAALQGQDAATLLWMPYLWTLALVFLPLALFVIVRLTLNRLERLER